MANDLATFGSSLAIGATVTAATAGSVLFATTSAALAQNNSKLFWDNTNFRLGIGTASPAHALDVTDGTVVGFISPSTTLDIGSSSNHAVRFFANNTEYMRLTTGGVLGIGLTPSVATHLEILGSSTSFLDFVIKGSGTDIGLNLNNTGSGGRSYAFGSSNSSGVAAGLFSLYDLTAGQIRYSCDANGAFIFGTPSGTQEHTFNGQYLSVNGASGATAALRFKQAGSLNWEIGTDDVSAGANGLYFYTGSTYGATLTSAGAWTLGPAGSNTSFHTLNGGFASASSTATSSPQCSIHSNGATANVGLQVRNSSAGDITGATFVQFTNAANTIIGTIKAATNTTTAYNTSSDERLKDNIADFTGAIDIVKTMQPRTFTWIAGGHADNGFIAQELQPVFPCAVSGSPESDVTQNPMAIDYGRITTVLTAALKELIAEHEQLKSDFDAYVADHP